MTGLYLPWKPSPSLWMLGYLLFHWLTQMKPDAHVEATRSTWPPNISHSILLLPSALTLSFDFWSSTIFSWCARAILSACKPRVRPHLTYTNVRKKPSPVCYREVKVLSYVCWSQFSAFAPIFLHPALPLPCPHRSPPHLTPPPPSVHFPCTPPTSPH